MNGSNWDAGRKSAPGAAGTGQSSVSSSASPSLLGGCVNLKYIFFQNQDRSKNKTPKINRCLNMWYVSNSRYVLTQKLNGHLNLWYVRDSYDTCKTSIKICKVKEIPDFWKNVTLFIPTLLDFLICKYLGNCV